ncbi:hypothetical protein BDZ89DRAFT_1060635 [Hymenopellis radicata]|nr:hypothetical protein BDZ89DRAFT_1060635 [Hymenopellis radicata]
MSTARNTADQAIVSLTYTPGKSLAEQLPVELISLIASFLARPSDHNESHIPYYSLCNLVSATHVCHRWREVILNDPRLWTDIQISVRPFWWPHASDILAKVLPLSGSLAFKISADFLEADPALTQILDVSTRCDSLTLILPYELSSELCRELICQGRPFPKLRCLSLTPFGFPDISQYDTATDYPKFWECFPALKELTFECSEAKWMSLPSARCLETVVIKIAGDAGELFFDFIRMLDSSETITSVTFHAMSCDKMEVLVNKKIETLRLKNYGVRLLHYVSCPALRTFSVDTLRWDSDGIPAEITENVLQSNIILGADKFPLFALLLQVDLFSDLSFLTDGVFEVVPVLEKLSIALPLVEEVDGKHFVKMIQERTASCMRGDVFALQECERRVHGLEIDICYVRGTTVLQFLIV